MDTRKRITVAGVMVAATLVMLGAIGAVYGLSDKSGAPIFSMNPTTWAIEKQGVRITPNEAPESQTDSYNPGVVRLADGEIWAYVKGDSSTGTRIYGWRSMDDGGTFEIQNELK